MRILLVAASSPFRVGPATGGGEQRSFLMHRALEELADVDVLMLYGGTGDGPKITRQSPLLVEGSWPPGHLRIRRLIDHRRINRALAGLMDMEQYDLIIGRHLWPVHGVTLPRDRPVIVDLDDLHFSYSPNAPLVTRLVQNAKMAVDYVSESFAMRKYDACWFVSARDQRRHSRIPSRILPNVPFPAKFVSDSQVNSSLVLFVGSLWYEPNQEAMEWFLGKCWRRIQQLEPRARFKIVGSVREADKRRWSEIPGVEVAGFVPDLAAAYAEAAFTVAPIFSGGGSNIKVLESLGHRRVSVTTTFASEAFLPHLRPGEHLAVVDDEEKWIDTCVTLLNNADRRAQLADRGYAAVSQHFSPDAFRRTVQELVMEVMSRVSSVPSTGPTPGSPRS
jgi:glycosyltransferase involved in cell wall biosynthesis